MGQHKQIQNISFIGSGNVATHLSLAFKRHGLNIVEVYSPNSDHANEFSALIDCTVVDNPASLNQNIDLLLISVPDSKIAEVFSELPESDIIIAHTSGICSIGVLSSAKHYGVFYPLQTFSKNKAVDLSNVPFCVEGSDGLTENSLKELADTISKKVNLVSSEERRQLHLAAVMVNNFTNHMYHMAKDVLDDKGIEFELLLPLIKETANKISTLDPEMAQTGPAKRNDLSTIAEHELMLSNLPDYKELYQLISSQISKKYHG